MGDQQQTAELTNRRRQTQRWAAWAAACASALVANSALAGEAERAAASPAAVDQADLAPRTELEAAAQALIAPIAQRHVVRGADGGLNLWLLSDLAFEKAVAEARRAISAKRPLRGSFALENWTYVDADRSGLMDLVGGTAPRRLRLTRHLHGVLMEVQDGADASESPRWLPPFRPQANPLMHGAMLR